MIKLKNVHKIYQLGKLQVPALRGVDLHVKKGEFVSIMGPSGSGKSTMLHLIGVLDHQTKGDVVIKGTDATKLSEEEKTRFRLKEIGFVFQFYSLLPELTALENVFIPQMLIGKNAEACRKNSEEVMKKLGLGERLHNYPNQLSGGEQQRVSIARALVNRPEILLADEPTAALDTKTGMNVVQTFKKLCEEINQTVVLITHEEEYGKMADRAIYLRDGLIEKEKRF